MSISTTFPPISGSGGTGIAGAEVPAYEINYTEVNTYADLPAANTRPNETYIVRQASGTWVLGTKKKAGLYYSDGVSWGYMGNSVSIDDTATSNESVWSSAKVATAIGSATGVTDHTLLTNIGANTHAQIDTALIRLANTSGANTGDQDLSGLATKTGSQVLSASDALSVSGTTVTLHKGDGTSDSITTQDTIYVHPATDGSLHVPATGTTNSGKVLTAGATAGTFTWETPVSGVTDHTLLSNIGTSTHAQIDTALARLVNTSGTNTGDETISTIKTKLGITTLSGSNTGDQDLSGYSLTTHNHTGVYEPADATILKDADIGSTVQAYDADTAKTDVAQTFTAAQRGSVSTVTYGANVTLNLASANNFQITMTGNLVLENPTDVVAGQMGKISLIQDGTGGRTVAWGTYFKFAGGTLPTYVTAANSKSGYFYSVESATEIVVSPIIDWK